MGKFDHITLLFQTNWVCVVILGFLGHIKGEQKKTSLKSYFVNFSATPMSLE